MNKDLNTQMEMLYDILKKNEKIFEILKRLEEYSKTNDNFKNYYVGAGSINQTVFNYLSDKEIDFGIKDVDIVYYDDDTSYEAEDKIIKDLDVILKDIDMEFDVKNEARVHIWYNKKYNDNREPYTSVEDAISKWGTTITCIGVRLVNDKLIVYAPYGLNDLFSMTIRPVKIQYKKEDYYKKVDKWTKNWPLLKIIEWD